jgi:hypothetical protein
MSSICDDVIGLDAADPQQRQSHCRDRVEQRLHLRTQIVGHRRSMRFVLIE